MANGVSVKMGVSGIAKFKQDINTAKTSIKTLDAELTLNEKQFKASGDAETYMQQKSELLQKKLEEQKSVVAKAEAALKQMADQGVNKASKAYQDMQQQLLRAKGDMLDTETQMQNIGTAGEEAGNGVDAMNAQLKRIGDGVNYQNVISGLDSITGGLEKVVRGAWKAGEAVIQATLGAGAWADELATTAAQYEITPEKLQRMRKTANLIDTDVDTILNAQKKFKQNIGVRDKTAMGAFAELLGEGYDPTLKKAEDAFWDIGEALMGLDNEYDKQVYAQKLFGKSWNELVPLFTTGREEYEKTMDSWSVVSDESLESLTKMDDEYQRMQGEFETFKNEMLATFSGPLTEGMETISGLFKEINEYLQTPEGKEMLAQMGETISSLISDLTSINPEEVVGGLKSVVDGITESLKWISEHSDDVVKAMEGIVAGWATLKVTGGVLKILEVISGLKWLQAHPNIQIPNVGAPAVNGTEAAGGTQTAAVVGANVSKAAGAVDFLKFAGTIGAMGFLIYKGGEALAEYRKGNMEKVRGTNENLEAESEGARDTLIEYIQAQQAMEALGWDATAEQVDELQTKVNELYAKLHGTQEGQNALNAYSDWRQENSYGNMDWIMPDEWQSAIDGLEKSNDKMNQAAEELTGESNSRIQSNSEMTAAAGQLQGMPAQVEAAIERGMSGIKIYIDGQTAGQVLTPHIGGSMAGIVTMLVK